MNFFLSNALLFSVNPFISTANSEYETKRFFLYKNCKSIQAIRLDIRNLKTRLNQHNSDRLYVVIINIIFSRFVRRILKILKSSNLSSISPLTNKPRTCFGDGPVRVCQMNSRSHENIRCKYNKSTIMHVT